MNIMKGKYNMARVTIDLDETTREQIRGFLNDERFSGSPIAIMPDAHAGKGSCVGFTMPVGKYVLPATIGVDIGCGVQSRNYGKVDLDVVEFDKMVKAKIPMGFSVHTKPVTIVATPDADYYEYDRAMCSLGTLGGGNHFIEAGRDSEGNLWITVHTGSRKLGLEVEGYHTKVAEELAEKYMMRYPCLPVCSDEYVAYQTDMIITQKYARHNRDTIFSLLDMGDAVEIIDTVHNYINYNDSIIRKGAVSAYEGEWLLIPFNMRDGIAICKGKGNKEWNYSAPHGAGRVLSRVQAKKQLSVEAFLTTMRDHNVYTTTAGINTLDEAPGAYKSKHLIVDAIKDTVGIVDYIIPIYNCKAGGD